MNIPWNTSSKYSSSILPCLSHPKYPWHTFSPSSHQLIPFLHQLLVNSKVKFVCVCGGPSWIYNNTKSRIFWAIYFSPQQSASVETERPSPKDREGSLSTVPCPCLFIFNWWRKEPICFTASLAVKFYLN